MLSSSLFVYALVFSLVVVIATGSSRGAGTQGGPVTASKRAVAQGSLGFIAVVSTECHS